MNVSTPSAVIFSTARTQSTPAVRWSTSSARAPSPSRITRASALARRAAVGWRNSTEARTSRIATAASAMSGECAATETGSTMARFAPSPFASSAAASIAARSPDTTIWPGEFRFATANTPCFDAPSTRAGTEASSRPRIAAMAPSRPAPLACIRRPRSRTRRIPSGSDNALAATIAEYWPIECPAWKRGLGRVMPKADARSCTATRYAIDVASRAGCAFTVRFSRSSGPSKARLEMDSPRASSAAANTAAAASDAAATARPIPTVCDPWPGKTRAKLVMSSGSGRHMGSGRAAAGAERRGPPKIDAAGAQ
jgi:hypothetical protein